VILIRIQHAGDLLMNKRIGDGRQLMFPLRAINRRNTTAP
jgi:hypothetical protein